MYFFKTFVPPSLCLALSTLAPKLQSEIVTWSVGQAQNPPVWSDEKNWSPEQLPDGGARVILPVGASPTLDMDSQTGPGDPPSSSATALIENILLNHQGTMRAIRGQWIITSPVLSAVSAKTVTAPTGKIEFRGGGQFALSKTHQFEVAPDSVIRLTGSARPYEFGTVQNPATNDPVLIQDAKLSSWFPKPTRCGQV